MANADNAASERNSVVDLVARPLSFLITSSLRHDPLVLYYQPKVDCRSSEVVGAEALVRWTHPERGLIGPDQFIPLAERSGLIRSLTVWVLDEAARQCAAWRAEGLHLPLAVNLSARNLEDRTLPDAMAAVLDRWHIPPGALEVELTESSLMRDPSRALEVLARLRSLGVGLAIDDFGTGYSSLAYLTQLTAHALKIDRSFVSRITVNNSDRMIVRSTIELAHNLGLRVIAEGVEDLSTWDVLADLECDEIQGYVVSRPVPAAVFAAQVWGTAGQRARALLAG